MRWQNHTITRIWRKLSLLALFALTACIGSTGHQPETTASPSPTPPPQATIDLPPTPTPFPDPPYENRLAWFYKPPNGASLAEIARDFKFFIMSKGDEPERDELLFLGARRPMLQYLRFEAIHDPGDCSRQPWRNNVAYFPGDFCQIREQHPDWFLLDRHGQMIVNTYDGEDFVMMDPGNPEWRIFFLERMRQSQEDVNWDGVFLDNIEVTFAFREQSGKMPAAYPDEASYQVAVQGFIKFLYNGYFQPQDKLLYGNLTARNSENDWTTYLTYLDGVMHEGWSIDWPEGYRWPPTWESQMALAEQTQMLGKFIVLVAQGRHEDLDLQKFAYASYLLINRGRAAFRYAHADHYREPWYYDTYDLDLGEPLGQRYQDGEAWRREFTKGSVMVNPNTHQAVIELIEPPQ